MSSAKEAWAKKKEALAKPVNMTDMPLIVKLLWKDLNVFSTSWLRDWWVVFKNRHALFSVLLCHPQHPFSWKERLVLITCVMMMGYAIASLAEFALGKGEEIALENAGPDGDSDGEIRKKFEQYKELKETYGAEITLFGSIFVQAFCALCRFEPLLPLHRLSPPLQP